MKQRFFVFDPALCFGCLGCVGACINANRTAPDRPWRSVHKLPPQNGRSDTIYLSVSCNHCQSPTCVTACPSQALQIRPQDGVVIHDSERCLGCRYCQMACPYGAIVWREDEKIVGKCQMCYDRLDRGQEPACVATCFSGALTLLTVEDDVEPEGLEKEMVGFNYHTEVKPRLRFVKKENA